MLIRFFDTLTRQVFYVDNAFEPIGLKEKFRKCLVLYLGTV
jgi:hypothetical protein